MPSEQRREWRCKRPPASGLALPLVLVLGTGCHLMVGLLLDSVRGEMRAGAASTRTSQALDAAERTLSEAASRLSGPLAFPASGCAAGLCANRQAPAAHSYDWRSGSAHAVAANVPTGGYWVEALGALAAGQSADCGGTAGGCEYVRVVASAAPVGVRRTLEACYRIRRSALAVPVVARVSWRETISP